MTDEQMDVRLRRAGATWRAATATETRDGTKPAAAEPFEPAATFAPRHTHRGALLTSAAAVVAALVAGGAFLLNNGGGHRAANTDTAGLKGTVWRLVAVGGGQQQRNSLSTLYIGKDGALVADDGCTLIGAHVDARDGHLYPSRFDVRYYQCVDTTGPSFTRAADILTTFPKYSLDGDTLTIGAMHFVAAPELPAPTLDMPTFLGAKWQLVKATDSDGTDHPSTFPQTLQIKNGRLTASNNCNTLTGDAVVDGQQVDLKNVTSTRMDCSNNPVIYQVFTGSSLHEQVDGTTLTIKGNGVGELVYQWVPSDKAATDPANLTGKTWHLTSVAGDPAAGHATLRIDGNKITGSDGCRRIDGDARVEHGSMTLTTVADEPPATCAQPARHQAATMDSFLAGNPELPTLWAIRDNELLIYGGGSQAFSLVFSTDAPPIPSSTANPDPLVGKQWTLSAIETSNGNSAGGEGFSDSGITLVFDGRTGFRVEERCNTEGGDYQVHGNKIDFSDRRIVDAHHCPSNPDAADEERRIGAVDKMLDGTVTWSVDDGQLTLTKGNTTLTFDS